MAEVGSAWVSILPSMKGFKGKLEADVGKDVKSSGSRLGRSFGKVFAAAGGALAAAGIGSIIKDSISLAGDLEQSIGAVDAVFKGNADQIHDWAMGAAQNVGLTRNEFNELGVLIGSQLRNGGTAMDDLAPKTNNLIKLGADLSSMFGGTTRDAVEALSSALKGERDPIERYGVSLNEAKIKARAAEMGFKSVKGQITDQAKQAATLSLIMDQTTDAHGNFADEADTLAGKQQRMKAEWENIKTELGTKLLPVMSDLVGKINDDLLPALENAATWIKENKVWAGFLAVELGAVAFAVLAITAPVTAVIVGLGALATALVYAYRKSSVFRAVVDTAFTVVRRAIGSMVGAVAGLIGMWAKMLRAISKVPGFGWAEGAADAMDNAAASARRFHRELVDLPREIDIRIQYQYFTNGEPPVGPGVLAPRAKGGPVSARTPYLVGEEGPEIFTPNSAGRIIPNHRLSSAASPLGAGNVTILTRIGDVEVESYIEAIVDDKLRRA